MKPAQRVYLDLAAQGVLDRASAVEQLAEHQRRIELTHSDVLVILDRFPARSQWDSQTSESLLHLIGEITPGGLPAALAALPDEYWVALERSPASPSGITGSTPGSTSGTTDHLRRPDPEAA